MASQVQPYHLPVKPLTIWPSPSLKHADLDVFAMPILYATIKGTQIGQGSRATFHFRLSFVNLTKTASIRLDMSPSSSDATMFMRGLVIVEYKNYATSASPGVREFQANISAGTTSGELCNYLFNQCNMDQYKFSDDGLGCRHWCITALECLATGGYVKQGVSKGFAKYEAECFAEHGSKFPMPRTQGVFYS